MTTPRNVPDYRQKRNVPNCRISTIRQTSPDPSGTEQMSVDNLPLSTEAHAKNGRLSTLKPRGSCQFFGNYGNAGIRRRFPR